MEDEEGGGWSKVSFALYGCQDLKKKKSAGIFLTSNSRSKIPFGQLERISGLDQ